VDKFHDEDHTHDGETQTECQTSIRSANEAKRGKPQDSKTNTNDAKFGGRGKVELPTTKHCYVVSVVYFSVGLGRFKMPLLS